MCPTSNDRIITWYFDEEQLLPQLNKLSIGTRTSQNKGFKEVQLDACLSQKTYKSLTLAKNE